MSLLVNIQKRIGAFQLGISFEAEDGVLGMLGASGCGKSMTLRCIAGIEKPDSGLIVLNGTTLFDSGRSINLAPQQRKIGFLFQNYALFPNMNVKQNILCGLRHSKDSGFKEQAFTDIMHMMRLGGQEKRLPDQLSGGQQQRVALARILIGKPNMLMLDEPFSALDAHLREQLQVQTKELLQQYGGISLLVTHSRDEAYQLCDRLAIMHDGRLMAIKPTKQLFANPETVFAARITGCKNISPARKTGEYEVEAIDWGIRLTTAQPVREDVCAIGIRGHYYSEKSNQNRFAIRLVHAVEEPFEWNMQFRYVSQEDSAKDLWWRIPKDRKPQAEVSALGISPVNVLPLYPEIIAAYSSEI